MNSRFSYGVSSIFRLALAASLSLVNGRAIAADPHTGEGIEVIVKTVAEDAVAGRVKTFSIGDGLVLYTEQRGERRLAFDEVVRLSANPVEGATPTGDLTVTLNNGDTICGRLVDAPPDHVAVETLDLGRLSFPLDTLVRAVSRHATTPAHAGATPWMDQSGAGDDDRALLTNGDSVRGFLSAIGPEGAVMRTATGESDIPLRLLVGVQLASTTPPPSVPRGVILTVRSTGRVTCTALDWAGRAIRATAVHGQDIRLEAERVVKVDCLGGRWNWLEQRSPTSFESIPMLGLNWRCEINRNALGGPLIVGGKAFEHGLGVHSRSRVTYDLKGDCREFVTYLGLDDASGPFADVDVAIVVDDRPRFAQTGVRRGSLIGPVRLNVAGAKQLHLIVDFGQNGDIQDRFDWIEPALIR